MIGDHVGSVQPIASFHPPLVADEKQDRNSIQTEDLGDREPVSAVDEQQLAVSRDVDEDLIAPRVRNPLSRLPCSSHWVRQPTRRIVS